jgi:hypothetical protein
MKVYLFIYLSVFVLFHSVHSQDTTLTIEQRMITLSEVVVNNNFNVPAFIRQVQDDTSFYKAFRNLRILSYTSLNDIRMRDKKDNVIASLESRTRQHAKDGCRFTEIIDQKISGDIQDDRGDWNYYTAGMYASLFFALDTVCQQTNVVGDPNFDIRNLTGLEKNREQLKMLFFNPGKKIPGVPLMGNKMAIFEKEMAAYYDFVIDLEEYQGVSCYSLRIKAKEGLTAAELDRVVIDEMNTWFEATSMQIMGRYYKMSYDAGAYDFQVEMEVQMTRVGDLVVPQLLKYNGNWDVAFKKRERGVFTAILFDFNSQGE